jgi:hypothetical protein
VYVSPPFSGGYVGDRQLLTDQRRGEAKNNPQHKDESCNSLRRKSYCNELNKKLQRVSLLCAAWGIATMFSSLQLDLLLFFHNYMEYCRLFKANVGRVCHLIPVVLPCQIA